MKLPIESRIQSPFNQMVELGVPVRIAKAVSAMLALPGTKTAAHIVIGNSVKEARSMLCGDMGEMLKHTAAWKSPTPPKLNMSEEDEDDSEDKQAENDALHLALDNVKLAYAVARNMGEPQERAMMLALYAHTRLL